MRSELQGTKTEGRRVRAIAAMPRAALTAWAVLALAGWLLTGCAGNPRTIAQALHPKEPILAQPRADVLTVQRPTDARPLRAESSTSGAWLTLLPLMPYGMQHISPETYMRTTERFPYDFPDDIGRAVTADLGHAGVARQVVYAADQTADHPGPHLYLTVREGEWRRSVTMYGLSLAGGFLWFLGAPASYGDIAMSVEADLHDASGRSVAKKVFTSSVDNTYIIYDPHALAEDLPDLYAGISSSLRKFVAENTPQF